MLEIIRYGSVPGQGSYGEVQVGDVLYKTIEQHWNDNTPFDSCVPCGIYELIPFKSNRFDIDTFALKSAPNGVYPTYDEMIENNGVRSECILHPANIPDQLKGCISFGEKNIVMDLDLYRAQLGVNNSRDTTYSIIEYIKNNNIRTLIISQHDICY